MSGNLVLIKSNKDKKKWTNKYLMLELNAARKKAKLLIAEPPIPLGCITCGQMPRDDHRTICGLCGVVLKAAPNYPTPMASHQFYQSKIKKWKKPRGFIGIHQGLLIRI
jgi:hypothetical protein